MEQDANLEAEALEWEAKIEAAALEWEAKIEAAKAAATEQEAKFEAATLEWEAMLEAAKEAALEQKAKLKAAALEVLALEQEAKLKAEKEKLDLQTAFLAAADTRLKVLHIHGESNTSQMADKGFVENVENPGAAVPSFAIQNNDNKTQECANTEQPNCSVTHEAGSHVTSVSLCTIVQQQNDNTELLSILPTTNIPVFKGDPLDYRPFMMALEYGVERETESNKDRLYYMMQYTDGRPREVINSCLNMGPDQGYHAAKTLLKEHFGKAHTISAAYINKALNWSSIKEEDGEALVSLALFLTTCLSAIAELDYMKELDIATNIRTIVYKLPYEMREKWRTFADDIKRKQGRIAKFKDLVEFVHTETKIMIDPEYGDLDFKGESKLSVSLMSEQRQDKTIFTKTTTPSAFTEPCLFCQGEHIMEQCRKIKKSQH
ncbi:uncharacterized protein LOC144049940 [Vanacampus margaritifer]